MINIIQELLQNEEYSLKEVDGKIILFKGELNHFPEEYIEIEKNISSKITIVSEVHRNDKTIKLKTKEQFEACIYAVVLFKKLFDNILNQIKVREIRNYMKLGEKGKALENITEYFSNSIYSIGQEVYMKLSLLQTGDKVDVKFGGNYIAESVSLSRGYVILYNYCEKLQYISSYFEEKQSLLKNIVNREQVLEWYILG